MLENSYANFQNGQPFDESVTDLRKVPHGTIGTADRSTRGVLDRQKTPIYKNKPIISKMQVGPQLKIASIDS